ncbi:hypothetical protein J3R82DRAFT_7056 [Butyriboletus roseoflavus]|nr:hypothetical protein J3R82DRAFT_7056 [Butyriboletus roseoflavus]
MDKSLDEVIATRPKNQRRVGRRASAKTQVLGSPANAATRAATQNAAAAKVVAAAAPSSQPADKIIVSNLPADVNEVQIKVYNFRRHLAPLSLLTFLSRNSSIPLLALFAMSLYTMTVPAGQKGLPRFTSREKEMVPRRTNSTTTASSMGVSIATFLSAFLRLRSWEQAAPEVQRSPLPCNAGRSPLSKILGDDTPQALKSAS